MSSLKKQYRRRRAKIGKSISAIVLLVLPGCFLVVLIGFFRPFIPVNEEPIILPEYGTYISSDDLQEYIVQFFTINNAEELIPIIGCESEFKHFNDDGTVLKNRQGSSATGIAQILASAHPDPQIIKRYNRRHHANLKVEDFDITTLMGNLSYALVLYEVRGTRDWECAKKI